jgi:hypothetical protein
MIPNLGAAAKVFSPSDHDWVVTVILRDGTIRNRRISPGTISEESAVAFAIAAEKVRAADVVVRCRRAGDRSLDISGADAFIERMRRLAK